MLFSHQISMYIQLPLLLNAMWNRSIFKSIICWFYIKTGWWKDIEEMENLFKNVSLIKGDSFTNKEHEFLSPNFYRTGYLGRKLNDKVVNLVLHKTIPNSYFPLSDRCGLMRRSISGVKLSEYSMYNFFNCSNIP